MTRDEFSSAIGASDQVASVIARYGELVWQRNAHMNLVGPSFEAEFWRRHAFDSAQLFHVEHQARRWADIGSGAGFPGIILAILLKDQPNAKVVLIESVAKRVKFLREVRATLDLHVDIFHGRAEAMQPVPKVDVVTARACAPLPTLLDYTYKFFQNGARGSFLKGRNAQTEISEARKTWSFEAELIPSLSDPTGSIVKLKSVERRA